MKLLFCQDCGDIIAPHPHANEPRWCACQRHAVWWVNPSTGVLRLWDSREGPRMLEQGRPYPSRPRAYVIGLTNALLQYEGQSLNAEVVGQLIDSHDDYYLFKRWRSLVIRIRPGESSDTGWAALPGQIPSVKARDLEAEKQERKNAAQQSS